ncbi:hypothetical protein WA158_000500 [Blastocystis sp. Blastoise]
MNADDMKYLLKSKDTKVSGRVKSAFAKYTSNGKLMCKLCNEIIRSDALWNSHLTSSTHISNMKKLQEKKTQPEVSSKKEELPQNESEIEKPDEQEQPKNILPEGFYDDESKDAKARGLDPKTQAKEKQQKDFEQFMEETKNLGVTAKEEEKTIMDTSKNLDNLLEQQEVAYKMKLELLKQQRQSGKRVYEENKEIVDEVDGILEEGIENDSLINDINLNDILKQNKRRRKERNESVGKKSLFDLINWKN